MTEPANPGDDDAPGTGEDLCPRCGGSGTGKVIEGIGGGLSPLPSRVRHRSGPGGLKR